LGCVYAFQPKSRDKQDKLQKVPLVAAVFRANGKRDRADEPARSFWASSFMNHYKGQIVVPGLGFYGRDSHRSLIRKKSSFCGGQLSRRTKEKTPQGTTFDDAEILAKYAGPRPDPQR
jgi:hypothetical protein